MLGKIPSFDTVYPFHSVSWGVVERRGKEGKGRREEGRKGEGKRKVMTETEKFYHL